MSQCLAQRRLLCGPGLGREPMHRLVRLGEQAFEDVRQIRLGIDALPVAVADERVERGGTVSGGWIAHEQPVLLADRAGADRVFNEVVVDLHAAMAQEHAQLVPLVERIAQRLSRQALRQMFAAALQLFESSLDALHDRGAVLLAGDQDFLRACACLALACFDLIQLLHLAEHPLRVCAFVPRFKNLRRMCARQPASSMRPARAGLLAKVSYA